MINRPFACSYLRIHKVKTDNHHYTYIPNKAAYAYCANLCKNLLLRQRAKELLFFGETFSMNVMSGFWPNGKRFFVTVSVI